VSKFHELRTNLEVSDVDLTIIGSAFAVDLYWNSISPDFFVALFDFITLKLERLLPDVGMK
jgi:hypothetical protein